jgi:hypothetical protein
MANISINNDILLDTYIKITMSKGRSLLYCIKSSEKLIVLLQKKWFYKNIKEWEL